MNVFASFDELATFSASRPIEMLNNSGTYGVNSFNATNPPIYDHLDPNFDAGIRRKTDDVIKAAIEDLKREWQRFGLMQHEMTAIQEKNVPKLKQYEAERRFRKTLEQNNKLREKYAKGGWKGIIFEPQIIELLPYDPQILTAGLKPPSSEKEFKNEVLSHGWFE